MNFLDLIYVIIVYVLFPLFLFVGSVGLLAFWIAPIFTKKTEIAFLGSILIFIVYSIYHFSTEISYSRSVKIRNGVLVQVQDNLKHLYADDGFISNGEYYFHYFKRDLAKVFVVDNKNKSVKKIKETKTDTVKNEVDLQNELRKKRKEIALQMMKSEKE